MDAKITPDKVRAARRPDRSVHRRRARRRRDQRPAILASILAVLALVGCVMAILMLATQPTAARLEREIKEHVTRMLGDSVSSIQDRSVPHIADFRVRAVDFLRRR